MNLICLAFSKDHFCLLKREEFSLEAEKLDTVEAAGKKYLDLN